MRRARLIQYLRKMLTRQPLAVPGSGGGATGGYSPSLNFSDARNSQYIAVL